MIVTRLPAGARWIWPAAPARWRCCWPTQGWDVIGLDSSAAMLEQARAKAENMATRGQVAFVQGDMRELMTTTNENDQ